jgi:hypothetical protein
MRSRSAAVGKDIRVVAAGVFESVGEDGHLVETILSINRIGDSSWNAVTNDMPRIDHHGHERIAEQVP